MRNKFDHRDPDYEGVYWERIEKLKWIRSHRDQLPALSAFYRAHPAEFINDWGMTFDPRNVEVKRPTLVPFILYPRQREWIDFAMERYAAREDALTEKSRELGVSWLSVALDATLCIFNAGFVAGYGSRTEDEVDKAGDPDCLFWKARTFIENLPPEFDAGWRRRSDAHLRIGFPATGSVMKGDAGENIGRGGRASRYTVDESVYVANPEAVDAALSQTTNCRMDISSVNGMANPFAVKRHSGKVKYFTFHWRDDPRKDAAWYAKQQDRFTPVIVAQELDINYLASATGVLIPGEWVEAAVDSHVKLGFGASGTKRAGLDVADQGIDFCSLLLRRGPVVKMLEKWSGRGSDTFASTSKAVAICDANGYPDFDYDSDGVGSSVRGDVRVLNEDRDKGNQFRAHPFTGITLFEPDSPFEDNPKKMTNADFYRNHAAQSAWELRLRFRRTWRAVNKNEKYDPGELISIPSFLPNADGTRNMRDELKMELMQPQYTHSGSGKLQIEKAPDGSPSPNLFDACKMAFARRSADGFVISDRALELSRRPLIVNGRRAVGSMGGYR